MGSVDTTTDDEGSFCSEDVCSHDEQEAATAPQHARTNAVNAADAAQSNAQAGDHEGAFHAVQPIHDGAPGPAADGASSGTASVDQSHNQQTAPAATSIHTPSSGAGDVQPMEGGSAPQQVDAPGTGAEEGGHHGQPGTAQEAAQAVAQEAQQPSRRRRQPRIRRRPRPPRLGSPEAPESRDAQAPPGAAYEPPAPVLEPAPLDPPHAAVAPVGEGTVQQGGEVTVIEEVHKVWNLAALWPRDVGSDWCRP